MRAELYIAGDTREVLSRSRLAWRCLVWFAGNIGEPTWSGDDNEQATMQTAYTDLLLEILVKLHRNHCSCSTPEFRTDSLAPGSQASLFKEGWRISLLPCSLQALRHTLLASCWHYYCKTMILSLAENEEITSYTYLFTFNQRSYFYFIPVIE